MTQYKRSCRLKQSNIDMIRVCNRVIIEANKKWAEWRERSTSTWHKIRDNVNWHKGNNVEGELNKCKNISVSEDRELGR